MKKCLTSIIFLCLLLAGVSIARAQEVPSPPNVLFIVREQIKPGKDGAHNEESFRFTQVLRKVKSSYQRLGMTPVAGSEHEVLYMWPLDSFAELEQMGNDMEKWATGQYKADFDAIAPGSEDAHVSQRDMVAVFRPDLSYTTNANMPEMRYMTVETFRLKPGKMGGFITASKMYIDGLKKGNVDTHYAVFQVVGGASQGTFLIFQPMKSLSELDKMQANSKAFVAAMGPEGMKSLENIAADIFVSGGGDSMIYAFNPRMSYVTDEFAARDKSTTPFWNPKP